MRPKSTVNENGAVQTSLPEDEGKIVQLREKDKCTNISYSMKVEKNEGSIKSTTLTTTAEECRPVESCVNKYGFDATTDVIEKDRSENSDKLLVAKRRISEYNKGINDENRINNDFTSDGDSPQQQSTILTFGSGEIKSDILLGSNNSAIVENESNDVLVAERCYSQMKDNNRTASREKKSNKIYQCPKCPTILKAKSWFNYHLTLHNSGNNFKCMYCDYAVNNYGTLARHERKHKLLFDAATSEQRQGTAEQGAVTFRTTSEVNRTTTTSKSSIVDENNNNNMMLCYNSQNGNGTKRKRYKFQCSECPARLFYKYSLVNHMRLHGSDKEYKCKLCNYAVNNRGSMAKHEKQHHLINSETNKKPIKRNIKKHACSKCPAVLHSKCTFRYHIGLHGQNYKHKCKFCDYAVNDCKGHITKHERLHQDENKKNDDDDVSLRAIDQGADNQGTITHGAVDQEAVNHEATVTQRAVDQGADNQGTITHGAVDQEAGNHEATVTQRAVDQEAVNHEATVTQRAVDQGAVNHEATDSRCNNTDMETTKRKLYLSKDCDRFISDDRNELLHTLELNLSTDDTSGQTLGPLKPKKRKIVRMIFDQGTDDDTTRCKAKINLHSPDDCRTSLHASELDRSNDDQPLPQDCPTTSEVNRTTTSKSSSITEDSDGNNNNMRLCYYSQNANGTKRYQFLCSKCPARLFHKTSFVHHMKLHGSDKKYKCELCNYAVNNRGSMAKHEKQHHLINSETNKKPIKRNIKKYTCLKCPAVLHSKCTFRYHIGLHGQNYKHKCKFCDYAVDSGKGHITKHEWLHGNENKKNDDDDDDDRKSVSS